MNYKNQSFMETEFAHFKESFRVDRRFIYVLLIELALIAALLFGYYVMTFGLSQMAPQAFGIKQSLVGGLPQDVVLLQNLQGEMLSIYRAMVVYIIIYALFAALACSFFKSLVYCVVGRLKLTAQLYWKFIIVGTLWSLVFVAVFAALQAISSNLLVTHIDRVWAQIVFVVVTAASLFILFYLTLAILTPLVHSSSIKTALKSWYALGVKRIHRSFGALLLALAVFVLLNVLLFIVVLLPKQVFVIITAILLLAYFVWLRFYLTAVWHRLSGGAASYRNPVHHALAHHAPAHQVPAHHTHHPKKR